MTRTQRKPSDKKRRSSKVLHAKKVSKDLQTLYVHRANKREPMLTTF